MGIRLLVDVIGKESILLKPAALSFCVFRFFFDSSFGQAGRVNKKGNLLHQPGKETGCLSGQLYIRVLYFP